jgi:hypothetical protein
VSITYLLALQLIAPPGDSLPAASIRFTPPTAPTPGYLLLTRESAPASGDTGRARAFVYSDLYGTRLTVHKWASWTMVPLFAAQYVVGQELYEGTTGDDGPKDAHETIATGIGALFAVNTVTGAWNLWEGRRDPNGRTRRWVHGITMLTAGAGFVATAAAAPDDDDGAESGKELHRTLAISSASVATAGWLLMLLWKE